MGKSNANPINLDVKTNDIITYNNIIVLNGENWYY